MDVDPLKDSSHVPKEDQDVNSPQTPAEAFIGDDAKRPFDAIGHSAFNGFGKRPFDSIGNSAFNGFGKRPFDSIGTSAFSGFGKREPSESEDVNDKRGFDRIGQSSFSAFGKKRYFDKIGQSSFSGFGKRGFDRIGQSSFSAFGKRPFDSIGQSSFSDFGKRGFDRIGQSSFSAFGKRPFDSIGQSSFSAFGKRYAEQEEPMSDKRGFDRIGQSSFSAFGKRPFDAISGNSAFSGFGKRDYELEEQTPTLEGTSGAGVARKRRDTSSQEGDVTLTLLGDDAGDDDVTKGAVSKRRFDKIDTRSSFRQFGKRRFDRIGSSAFSSFGKRSDSTDDVDQNVDDDYQRASKRYFDRIGSHSAFSSFGKRHFDRIGSSAFSSFGKRHFDRIGSSAFSSFGKRNFDRIGGSSAFTSFGKRRLSSVPSPDQVLASALLDALVQNMDDSRSPYVRSPAVSKRRFDAIDHFSMFRRFGKRGVASPDANMSAAESRDVDDADDVDDDVTGLSLTPESSYTLLRLLESLARHLDAGSDAERMGL